MLGAMKTALKIGILALAAVAVLIATQPADFRVERRVEIDAPPEVVFPLVDDLHAWTRWSPWEAKDPAMERVYSGPRSGVGASYAWSGNADVGSGRMTIQDSQPSYYLALELAFLAPFEATNQVSFSFVETERGTEVIWAMTGTNGLLGRVFALLMDPDAMVGEDFETGLAALRTAAESDLAARRRQVQPGPG
jgi:hypothetical protein